MMKMKKKMIAALMSAACVIAAVPSASVFADGQKVVTLGADLSDEQKQAILRYFGVAGQNLQTLTITNQDERNHLGSYVPLEQIGTRTYSCALVSPTNSGGIQVKTANLSWVTSNMIAATLSTSGVVNCDVLAASPFEVSGTGALTGILMAYESAVGTTLDETKKEVATQELITTTTIANNIGPIEATEIVNETKTQIIEGNVISDNDIDVIINEVAKEQDISLSDEDRKLLTELMQQIAQQEYDYEDMKETLDRIESNMKEQEAQLQTETSIDAPVIDDPSAQTEAPQSETQAQSETQQAVDPDSILMNTDDSALGDSVIFDATDDSALTETEAPSTEAPAQSENADFDITSSDSYGDGAQQSETQAPTDTPETQESQSETSADITIDTQEPQSETADATADTNAAQTEAPVENPDDIISSTDGNILDGGADIMVDPQTEENSDGSMVLTSEDMVFAPVTSEENGFGVYPAGIDQLTVYFRRGDIVAGTGSVTLHSSDGSVSETIQVSDTEKAVFVPMTPEELLTQGWEEGTKAVLFLEKPLAQNMSFYVTLSADAFASSDASAHSEEIADTTVWAIQTSQYGVYLDDTQPSVFSERTTSDQIRINGIAAGSTVSGQIMIDGSDAVSAAIENSDPAMATFDTTEFSASGSFTATFAAEGETSFQITFYDAAGTPLKTISLTVTVAA